MSAPRGGLTLSAILVSPLVFALSLGAMAASAYNLTGVTENADVFDYALSLEAGAKPQLDYVTQFASEHALNSPRSNCGDSLTRAQLTITLAQYQAALDARDPARMDSAVKAAMGAAEHRLQCNPLDGNAWLQLSRLKSTAEGPSAEVVEELALSHLTAPNEAWILEPRLDLETAFVSAGVTGLDLQYNSDLRKFVDFESTGRTAAIFVDHQGLVRQRLRPLIDQQPERRRKSIVAEIDRLGVDYSKP